MAASAAYRQQTSSGSALEPGDFPIVIGDSLKNEAPPRSDLLRLRYNWEPSRGFNDQVGTIRRTNGGIRDQRGTIKRTSSNIRLAYHDQKTKSPTYEYKSNTSDTNGDSNDKPATQLVLVFDPSRSAYVLERISHSLDLNLTSAHDHSNEDVERYTRITGTSPVHANEIGDDRSTAKSHDMDEADPTNPFDFRNFLTEAKENAEKGSLSVGGARTPIPGSRTPISVISSPALAASRFLPNSTPQFRPTPTSVPVIKKSTASKSNTSVFSKKQNPGKKKAVAAKPSTPQPLSKEIISDSSDEESSNTITVSQTQTTKNKDQASDNGASSAGRGRSHTVVNDGGLEIDLGSPPPEPKRRDRLDLEAFRSQTHTPVPGPSGNRRAPILSHLDVEMKDASEAEDEVNSPEDHNDDDMDEDVETFELPSPQSKKADLHEDEVERMPLPLTPQAAPAQEEEEDDFTRELEEALAREDDEVAPVMNVIEDDESEVSEEE